MMQLGASWSRVLSVTVVPAVTSASSSPTVPPAMTAWGSVTSQSTALESHLTALQTLYYRTALLAMKGRLSATLDIVGHTTSSAKDSLVCRLCRLPMHLFTELTSLMQPLTEG